MKELDIKVVLTGGQNEEFKVRFLRFLENLKPCIEQRLAERTGLPVPQDFSALKPESKTAGDPHGAVAVLPSSLGTFSKDALRSLIGGFDILLLGQEYAANLNRLTSSSLALLLLVQFRCVSKTQTDTYRSSQVDSRSDTIKALQNINLVVAACSAAAVDGLALARAELPLHPPSLCAFIQVRMPFAIL